MTDFLTYHQIRARNDDSSQIASILYGASSSNSHMQRLRPIGNFVRDNVQQMQYSRPENRIPMSRRTQITSRRPITRRRRTFSPLSELSTISNESTNGDIPEEFWNRIRTGITNHNRELLRTYQLTTDLSCNCSICTDGYYNQNNLIFLPCNHYFHQNCINQWFNEHNICPICRDRVSTNNNYNLQPIDDIIREDIIHIG